MAELKLVEGWTGPIDETLKSNGVAVNLTGLTVDLLLHRADGTLVTVTGNVAIQDAANGVVRFNPDATDLIATDTPHIARWKVTDGAGKVVFFPNAEGEGWTVFPAAPIALQDNALLTLGELRSALNLKGNDQDATLARFINGTSDALETYTGRRLKSRTYTALYQRVKADDVLGDAWFDVEWPITALSALAVDGTAQTIWMPGAAGDPDAQQVYVLEGRDPKRARDRIHRAAGWTDGTLVKITYTAGYGPIGFPVPEDLKQPCLVLARDWFYLRDRQAQAVQSHSSQGETTTYINEALPRQFRPLIASYRRWHF